MTTTHDDKAREQFEHWFSDEGKSPAAVERSGDGYKLMQAQAAWWAWEAAWNRRAALSPASTGQTPEWIGKLYAYLESTCPAGLAAEAFRVAPEEVRAAIDSLAHAAGNVAGVDDISTPETGGAGSTDYEALEREHLGDADKRTGIYHPDNRPQSHGGYCADCNSWAGEHQDGCQKRRARFFAAPAKQVEAEIRDKALEEAAKKCEGFPCYQIAQRSLLQNAAAGIRSLKSAAGSNNGEKG